MKISQRNNWFSKAMFRTGILVSMQFLFLVVAVGQFNVKIGYDGAFAPVPGTNAIIDRYNRDNAAKLNDQVAPLHWFHGINMGVRYKLDYLALELSWESLGAVTSAVEVNGNSASQKKIYYRLNHLSLSNELIYRYFGVGASIDMAQYKIESELSGVDENKKLATAYPLTSKFFIALHVKGSDYLSFAIKPYYRVQWGRELPLAGLATYLSGDSGVGLRDSFDHFGLTICFYNGWQSGF